MIKVESMDAVHGRSGVTKAGKATVQPGRWAGAATARGGPHGDVVLVSSGRRPPYHQSGNPCSSFAWRCFIDCFIHENGNDNAVVITLWRVCDSAEDAEPMCALSRRQSTLGKEENLARLEASPSLWLDALSRRGSSPREKSLSRPRQACGDSPGLESPVLSEIS